jgi:pilus assembly protein CpaE
MGGEAAKAVPADSGAVRFVACVADDVTRETVSRSVANLGWSDAKVRAGGIDTARRAIDAGAPPTLMLVDITESSEPVKELAELAEFVGPDTTLLAIGAVNDVSLYRQLTAFGVADYLVKPVSAEVLSQALTASLRVYSAPGTARTTQLFAFIGARGGVGTTTLAISTAWLLAHEYKLKTTLIDLDLHFGNLALSLDLEPGRGLREALDNPARTDAMLLAAAMVSEAEKVPILASEEPLEEHLQFDGAAVAPLLTALAEDYNCLIVDLPRTLDQMARQVIAAADSTIVVTDLSLSALRDTHRLIDLAKSLEARTKPLVIANQIGATHRGEIGRAEFERGIGGPIDLAIPFEVKAAIAAAQSGKPLAAAAAKSTATIELRRFAGRLVGREEEAKSRGGLLSRFKR